MDYLFSRDQIDSSMRDIINAITDMVCDWIPIVKEVLDVTSESILLKIQQGPASELQFWKNRKENLEFIQEQVLHFFLFCVNQDNLKFSHGYRLIIFSLDKYRYQFYTLLFIFFALIFPAKLRKCC